MDIVILPLPIERYFASRDGAREVFAADAVVWDNGEDKELRGVDAIEDWMRGNSGAYDLKTDVKSLTQKGLQHVVGAVVSGTFPGSPYEFEYRFKLADGRIQELVIDPVGPLAP
ncbi:MAG: nuclear transport factor 2 family protein [Fimbriimonadaceae bacterium]|nr:nuclear transport factor 2 family protein [Fimbriimonadaceae bacterium]QYK55554.1 MAG: nuclear transport factor 2 family protein [Fimbriimonadaceae bacterium]